LGNLGIVASNRGDYDGALQYYERAVAIDKALGNKQAVARHIGNMGYEYYLKREIQPAMAHWLKALKMEQAMGNVRAEARALGNLGAGYRDVGDFSVAERCLAPALQMDMAAGHRDAMARHIGNLAVLYQWQAIDSKSPVWEQAEMAIQPAIHLTRQLNDGAHLAENLLTAAQLAFATGRWAQAAQLVQECLPLAKKLNREDVALPAAVLNIQVRVKRGEMGGETAVRQYQRLLADYPQTPDQATLFDAIWQVDPTHETARIQAARLFAAAHERFPHVVYRQRYHALTGSHLPAPTPLPPPEALPLLPDLAALFQELHQFLVDGEMNL
jgi:tetratricopeptide (TPR) repeat protein